MAQNEKVSEFPDVGQKLAAPRKISQFEKDRQAAEAKRQRAEAENAAALKAFEDSFADRDEDDHFPRAGDGRFSSYSGSGRGGYGPGPPSSRHGGPPSGPRSGPGYLGHLPGNIAPPPSLKRKRALDEMRERQEAFLGEPRNESKNDAETGVDVDEHEDDAPRPTIQLSSLPPAMTLDDIKRLLSSHLNVQSVRFVSEATTASNTKQSLTAIATLSSDTSTSQIDTAVSTLKDKYVGFGFRLSISRHLSSAALHSNMSANSFAGSAEPFGAERSRNQPARFSMRNAPPPMDQRGFAPPESYETTSRSYHDSNSEASIDVQPPLALETAKAVHTVIDHLLLEPDPEQALRTEALLMSLPEVQSDERFAFLYDSRSPAGRYYRFCLWTPEYFEDEIREKKRRLCGPERLFDDVAITWLPPYAQVTFPDLTSLAEVVSDIDYISSDEESDDEDEKRKFNSGPAGGALGEPTERKHIAPLQRARLVHLLARLPTSIARLRKGDVARITHFAIKRAGEGAEEIVDALLLNVEKPFSSTSAAKYEDSEPEQEEEDEYEPDEELSNLDSTAPQVQAPSKDGKRDEDPTGAKLVALYVISDILSASSTAGARNAWKYRQLFESGFKSQKTFEHLGKLDKEMSWGRLKSEQWKRKIDVVFGIWEGWSVFPNEVQEELKSSFFEPPLSDAEKAQVEADKAREDKKQLEQSWAGKFKRVGGDILPAESASPATPDAPQVGNSAEGGEAKAMTIAIEGQPIDDSLDGSPLKDEIDGKPFDEDVDGEPLGDDVDGEPLMDDIDSQPHGREKQQPESVEDKSISAAAVDPAKDGGKSTRRRMRAEDMFADSDED